MKIVCDSCATKYQIADEKVSGKAFKIRCKKCGHVIVVNKGAGDGAGGQAADAGGAAEPAPAPEAAAPTDAVWHLVIDREQVGPMTVDEVRAKVQAGQVDADTYGWKEGFDDWLKLSAIEDFKTFFTAAPPPSDQATKQLTAATGASAAATAILSPGNAAPAAETYTGGAAGGEQVRTAAPGAATLVAGGADAYVQRGAAAAEAAGGGIDAPVKSMTGARSENSVLFSLNNLSALAGSGGGGDGGGAPSAGGNVSAGKPGYATPQSEASGLIDIRAMAAATLGVNSAAGPSSANKAPDLFGGADPAPVFTPIAPAVLMPSAEPAGVPKWVFALVGVGGLMFVGMIVVLVMFVGDSKPTPTQPTTGPATTGDKTTTVGTTPSTPTGPAASGTTPSTPTGPAATGTTPSTKPSTPSEPATKDNSSKPSKSKPDKAEKSSSKSSSKEPAKTEKEPETPAPKPVETPKPAKPAKPKDDLDSLLDSASSGSGGKPGKQEAKADLPDQLSQSQIKSALNKASTGECKAGGASGVYMIKLTIGKNGSVSNASLSSGGGNGDCVVSAVKKVKFDQFSGDAMSITYPVLVR